MIWWGARGALCAARRGVLVGLKFLWEFRKSKIYPLSGIRPFRKLEIRNWEEKARTGCSICSRTFEEGFFFPPGARLRTPAQRCDLVSE